MHGNLSEVIESIKAIHSDEVDAREWTTDWSDKWVAFIDLIGIAERSRTSSETTVNQIVRFHRALSAADARYDDIHLSRFTDAAYATSLEAETVVKFAADIHHYCLALNAIQLDKPKCFFHHMIIPRTTIAYGNVLEAKGPQPTEERYVGVHAESLLIGGGIVEAYKLEKRTAGGLISVSHTNADAAKRSTVRGVMSPPRRVLRHWLDSDELLSHDGVIDVPWLILRSQQPLESGLWTASYADVLQKIRTEIKVWRLSFTEYTTQRLPIDTIKHFGGVNRHLNELFQNLKRHTRLKAWSLKQLEEAIQAEQERLVTHRA